MTAGVPEFRLSARRYAFPAARAASVHPFSFFDSSVCAARLPDTGGESDMSTRRGNRCLKVPALFASANHFNKGADR